MVHGKITSLNPHKEINYNKKGMSIIFRMQESYG